MAKKIYIGVEKLLPPENCLLLIHGDEPSDASKYNRTLTSKGVTFVEKEDSINSKVMYFDGSNRIDLPIGDYFNFGSADFTIEWREFLTENINSADPFAFAPQTVNHFLIFYTASNITLYLGSYAGTVIGTQKLNKWVHRALVRKGATLYSYEDGVKAWSGSYAVDVPYLSGYQMCIGNRSDSPQPFKGYMEEFAVFGSAKYNGNFQPPTKPCEPIEYETLRSFAKEVQKLYVGIDGIPKEITKAYVGVDGIAKLVYDPEIIPLYTGRMTKSIVTVSGKQYMLLTLVSSGTLTFNRTVNADIWMCNGGEKGQKGSDKGGDGGNGGKFRRYYDQKIKEVPVVIGAGNGGVTSFGGVNANQYNGGGAGKGATNSGVGAGGAKASTSTLPFNMTQTTNGKYPCAGGAGADYGARSYYDCHAGGHGGQWDKAGDAGFDTGLYFGGDGGETGGGDGGGGDRIQGMSEEERKGQPATFYGSGGGGGTVLMGWMDSTTYDGGNGYQGVVYVRVSLS